MPPLSNRLGSVARAATEYAAGRIVATEAGRRLLRASAAFSAVPPPVPGAGQPTQVISQLPDEGQRRIIGRREALYGSVTHFAGPIATAYTTFHGGMLTPQYLNGVKQSVRTSGIMMQKADIDEAILMQDGHALGVDRSCRVEVTGSTFLVRPSDDTDIAKANAKYMDAVCANIDSFSDAWYELLQANGSGFKTSEIVYQADKTLRFKLGTKTIAIRGPHPQTIVGIHNKHINFDVGTDAPRIDMGNGKLVTINRPQCAPRDEYDYDQFRFIYHKCAGDGHARLRGYMYSVWPMYLLKWQAIARLGVVLNVWGVPVPWGTVPMEIFDDPVKKAQHESILAMYGLANPILSTDEFKIRETPTPPNLDARGMHMAAIGLADTAMSKAIQGETLTTEVGGVAGSYALGGVQADTKESVVAQNALDLANTLRQWLFTAVLILNQEALCKAYNDAGIRCEPWEILAHIPRPFWVIARSMTPQVQLEMAKGCVNDLGLKLDAAHFMDSIGMVSAADEESAIKGKPTELKQGARTVGAAEASAGASGAPPKEDAAGAAPSQETGGGHQGQNSPQAPSPQS